MLGALARLPMMIRLFTIICQSFLEDWHFIKSDRHFREEKYYFVQDISRPYHSPYYDQLIMPNTRDGFEFMAGGGGVNLMEERGSDSIDEIKEERVRALVRLEFVDPLDKFTPLRHDTVGAAIARNLAHAPPEHRLDNLLAVEAKKYTSLLPKISSQSSGRSFTALGT